MSSDRKIKNNIVDIDIDGIIKKSIKKQLGGIEPVLSENVSTDTLLTTEAYHHEPKPFKQVSELVSQKTKNSHTDLYKGYVESLNKTSAELDTVDRADSNPRHSKYRSLKLDEVFNLNAAWLHELYFSNCFDPHSEVTMDSMAFLRIERDFGSFEDWQRDFMACALSSQNGWAVMGYHMFLRKFVNVMIDGHDGHVPVGFYPVVVVDMWEHSYYRDYLSDKKSYLISQMREFNWNVIEERVKKAEALGQVLR